jgi:parvulin-like peptidyl-prolyl isomerase
MKFLLKIFVMLIVIHTLVPVARGELVDQIVAIVNKKVITLYETRQVEQQLTLQNPGFAAESPEARRQQVLDFLIENVLVRQKADDLAILVTEEELDVALQDIERRNNLMSDEQLKALVQQQGQLWEEFLDNIRGQIKMAKLVNMEVNSQIDVTENDVEAYYYTNPEQFEQVAPMIHIRHILLSVDQNADDAEVQTVKEQALQLIQELRAGADFVAIAKQYSDHPSSETGGELGTFKQGDLAPPFDEAFALNVGDVSEPVRSDLGFHILFVDERTGGQQASFEKAKPAIRQKLLRDKSNERYQAWLEGLKAEAYIEIKE